MCYVTKKNSHVQFNFPIKELAYIIKWVIIVNYLLVLIKCCLFSSCGATYGFNVPNEIIYVEQIYILRPL